MWCIPSKENAAFACAMEQVLAVYQRPFDPNHPVVCMDETSKQCVKEVRQPLSGKPGQTACYDSEYERNGVAHLILFYAPFIGWRRIQVGDNHKAVQWAHEVRRWVDEAFPKAKRITRVMDHLNTHTGASLYKAFPPEEALRLLERLEFVYTPKHGSWLNIAECEFSVLSRQCLDRRMSDMEFVSSEVAAWSEARNAVKSTTQWRFTTEDARIKLKHLYPANIK